MSELILKFNLPEEQMEADIAANSQKLLTAVFEFQQDLRQMLKYGDYKEEEYELLEKITDMFWEKMNSNGVSNLLN